jgi:hypothetical protein
MDLCGAVITMVKTFALDRMRIQSTSYDGVEVKQLLFIIGVDVRFTSRGACTLRDDREKI